MSSNIRREEGYGGKNQLVAIVLYLLLFQALQLNWTGEKAVLVNRQSVWLELGYACVLLLLCRNLV